LPALAALRSPTPAPRPNARLLALAGLWLGLLVVVQGCGRQREAGPIHFERVEDGCELARPRVRGREGGEPFELVVLRLDPARFSLGAVHDPGLSDAQGFREASGALAAINGHFFDPAYKPLGLLVSDGRELSRLRKVDHGVFTIAAGRPDLQHAKAFSRPEALEFAIECGPRLVADGKPLDLKRSRARRTALGYDAEGRVLVVASTGVVALRDLADVLARPPARGGLGAVGALNLDGGSSTMFDLAAPGRRISIRSAVRVPVGVVVRRRAER
jgi:uncharacterized protein YigE (DUF2233 family)